MILVDRALAEREASGAPVRVALVGAGFVARQVALHLLSPVPGLRMVAVANRTVDRAEDACRRAGAEAVRRVEGADAIDDAIVSGCLVVTDDVDALCAAEGVDVVIEATGHVEHGTRACLAAIRNGKHVVLLGAEVDASVGPVLKAHADLHGVVYTYTDGDEPGVAMNLVRFVQGLGCRPVLAGQMKGFLDRYRNPDTQRELAARLGQNPAVLASFADGSKLALEATVMGNATGFVPRVRGMGGVPCAHVNDLLRVFQPGDFVDGGLVEYSLGAAPHTGAFVMCENDHPEKRKLLSYLKMGDGPLYLFYQPWHLPPWEVANSVARAALFHDATAAPRGAPVCDTVACAKRDLRAGERLDGMGGFTCYGLVDRYETCLRERTLPIAVSLDCVLLRDVAKDEPITYDDVELPAGRLVDRLRVEQEERFRHDVRGEPAGSESRRIR